MTDQPPDISGVSAEAEDAAHASLGWQLGLMLQALRTSAVGKLLVRLGIAIVLVVAATAYAQIRLNQWNKPFFDALSRRDFRGFLVQLGVFLLIAGALWFSMWRRDGWSKP